MTIRSLELFACSGGMSEGFRRAGLPFTWSVDWDADACESHASNLGQVPIRMDIRDLLRLLKGGWRPPPLDLLVADPPCAPWSTAGRKRGLGDPRDMLRPTIAIIELLKPRAYLIGNVPGLQNANAWPVVQELIGGLAGCGYCANDYAQLNAADYGVPQHRKRPFWFGYRGGSCLRWPEPTHGDPKRLGYPDLGETRRPWFTCRDALGHLSADELGTPVRVSTSSEGQSHRRGDPDAPARTLTCNTHGDGALLKTHPQHPINTADRPSKTVCAGDRGVQGALAMEWPWDRPCTTITGRLDQQAEPGHGSLYARSGGDNAIKLSEKAATILQGFPELWSFAGRTKKSRWSQLGQAMPPPLAEAVARSVKGWFAEAGA